MAVTSGSNGLKIAYDSAGAGDPPLVFVHGWCCDRSYFSPQFDHFGARHAVASVDLRGHGESEASADGKYSVEGFADDAAAVIEELGFDRPVVVGHSMGGLVAMALGARPGATSGVVLVDPAPLCSDEATRGSLESMAQRCASDHDGAWRSAFVAGMFLPTDRVRRDQITAGMPAAPTEVAAGAVRAMAEFDPDTPTRIEVPVLAIGSASPSNTLPAVRRLCARATTGQTVGSGHFNQLEVPEQINAMIERWLATEL
jgi:pimeloyl-ACP methyl ester carboxylesterase